MVDCTDDIDTAKCECINTAQKYRELINNYENQLDLHSKYVKKLTKYNTIKSKLKSELEKLIHNEKLSKGTYDTHKYTKIGDKTPGYSACGSGVCSTRPKIIDGVKYNVEPAYDSRNNKIEERCPNKLGIWGDNSSWKDICKWTPSSVNRFMKNWEEGMRANGRHPGTIVLKPTFPKLNDLHCCSIVISDLVAMNGGSIVIDKITQNCGDKTTTTSFKQGSKNEDSKKNWYSKLIDIIKSKNGMVIIIAIILVICVIIY